MKYYLSGPMRGFPDHNYPFFTHVTTELRKQGVDVLTPCEVNPLGTPRNECMTNDIKAVLECDAVLCLPGWQESPGAVAEVMVAWATDKPVFDLVAGPRSAYWRIEPSTTYRMLAVREEQYRKGTPLVGVCGYAQSGKDTVAKYLVETFGWTRIAFADALRDVLHALDPIADVRAELALGFDNGDWSAVKVEQRVHHLVEYYGWDYAKIEYPEVRELLQRLGTEAGRNILGENLWVAIGEEKIESADTPVVVSDVRFQNELRMVRRRGGLLVWVNRPGVEPVNAHISERSVTADDCDVVIDNGSAIEDLYDEVCDHVLERLIPTKVAA